jgi:hypothetical protein
MCTRARRAAAAVGPLAPILAAALAIMIDLGHRWP